MKTLYLTDLDGTLLGSDGKVSKECARIIYRHAKEGLLLSVATARTFMTAGTLVESLDLRAPAVLNNGVFLYDLKQKRCSPIMRSKLRRWSKRSGLLNGITRHRSCFYTAMTGFCPFILPSTGCRSKRIFTKRARTAFRGGFGVWKN